MKTIANTLSEDQIFLSHNINQRNITAIKPRFRTDRWCFRTDVSYPKWTQTGLKSQIAWKSRSVHMAISLWATLKTQTAFKNCPAYMEISLRQLSKP